ncbi:MAG TPA: hypothetical protein VFZ61_30620 [Polyangiales bacterium]
MPDAEPAAEAIDDAGDALDASDGGAEEEHDASAEEEPTAEDAAPADGAIEEDGSSSELDADAEPPTSDAGANRVGYGDVEPILRRHCAKCHVSGAGAPFNLTFYEEVAPLARDVRTAIVEGTMPPCNLLGPDCGLSQAEIDTISLWVEQGAQR